MKRLLLNLDKQREFLPFTSVRRFSLSAARATTAIRHERGHGGWEPSNRAPRSQGDTASPAWAALSPAATVRRYHGGYKISPPAYSRAGAEQKGNPVVLEYGAQISTKRLEADNE